MTINEWLYTKISGSTNISGYSTRIYPDYIPMSTSNKIGNRIPCYVYTQIGFNRNRIMRNQIFSITSVHDSKLNAENMNDQLYSLFDNSTGKLSTSSSNLFIDSIEIINNGIGVYDTDNKYWTRVLDVSVWYRIGG